MTTLLPSHTPTETPTYILGIESSCDDTSAAVLRGNHLLSNVIASQAVHSAYGGVVPELASRSHLQNIVPVVSEAIKRAQIHPSQLSAIAFTNGPGLLGSLLVGTNFAKGLSLSLQIPLVEVNHLRAHVLAHFIQEPEEPEKAVPQFPFLCLLVSGGNSQIIRVDSPQKMTILGQTIDDAAGEAFDKCAKVLGLGYPGGPMVDKWAEQGDPNAFLFARPNVPGYDYSFSGLKTSFLYTLRDALAQDPQFIEHHMADLCASLRHTIVEVLMKKLVRAARDTGIRQIAVAGGVSANQGLRKTLTQYAARERWTTFVPKLSFTTDNAAMVAMAGYYNFLAKETSDIDSTPFVRTTL